MKIPSRRYICPQSRTQIVCRTCGETALHIKEELVAEGAAIPMCTLHGEKMVLADLTPNRTTGTRRFTAGYHAV